MGRTSSSRRFGWALTAQGRGRLGEDGDRMSKGQARGSRKGGGGESGDSNQPEFSDLTMHGVPTETEA